MDRRYVFKICSREEWAHAQRSSELQPNEDDRRDGFMHFSLAEQLRGTLDKHFAGRRDLVLVRVRAEQLGESLRFEVSRGGKEFPHLYGPLALARVDAHWQLSQSNTLPLDLLPSQQEVEP